jgi:ATP-dependent DNA helicase UvrD/PcrA
MKNNRLLISAAGSGKTTFLVKKALELGKSEKILITTYTNENEEEIRKNILKHRKSIPSNITIQGWFSFLLQHGVKPYQGAMNNILFENDIKGMFLSEGNSSIKRDSNGRPIYYKGRPLSYGESDFKNFYFTKNWNIYSDKISKFIVDCNARTDGEILSRISRIYSHIYIDEVQDLAGYDLEIIKLLFSSNIDIILAGDPRQVTYLTNHYRKHPNYKNGKIKEFLLDKCKSLLSENSIDETTLKKSHRNNKAICDYSSKLYPEFEIAEPCDCRECRSNLTEHEGIFLLKSEDVDKYVERFKTAVQLVWDKTVKVNPNSISITFGKSKGKTYDRVIIYPTDNIKNWIKDNSFDFTKIENGKKKKIKNVKEKFYVAITRARHSVAIVFDFTTDENIEGVQKYVQNKLVNETISVINPNILKDV